MKKIQVITDGMAGMVDAAAIAALDAEARNGLELLTSGEGAGADFLGWVKLPEETDDALLDDINATAARLRETCEVVVAVGIGGSYLGAKAVIEALSDSFAPYRAGTGTRVLFAGQNIGEDYMAELQDYLRDKKFGIIVISKSGTTTEPAIAFRLLKDAEGAARAAPGPRTAPPPYRGCNRCTAWRSAFAGNHRRLQDLCNRRQCRRPLLGAHSGRSAPNCGCRLRHPRTGGRCPQHAESDTRRKRHILAGVCADT